MNIAIKKNGLFIKKIYMNDVICYQGCISGDEMTEG